MKIVRQTIWAISLVAVGAFCVACGAQTTPQAAPLTEQQKADAAKIENVGNKPVGGGMVPLPKPAKPGEKVGAPPPGGRSGGN